MKKIIYSFLVILLPGWVFCQVKVTNGTYLVTSGNVQVVIHDLDLINDGVFTTGNSHFLFSGSVNTSIGGSGNLSFNNFTVNKTGTRQVFLTSGITVNHDLNFLSGLIELNNHDLNLMYTGNLVGESEISRIKGATGGYVMAVQVLNAPNAANPGNLGAIITSAADMGSVEVKRGHTSQNAVDANGKSINRVFVFNVANNNSLDATLKLKYFNAELNGINENELSMYSTDFGITYFNINYLARDAAANFVSHDKLNAFGIYTLSAPAVISLPVTLIDFTATCKSNFIQLAWKTVTETNSDRFDIERSNNGITWYKTGSVNAAGNSNNVITYQYNDSTLTVSSAFYRLAQYDLGGKLTYSPVVKAGCGQSTVFNVMPNPVADFANVTIGATGVGKGTLILYNAAGQLMIRQAITITNGTNQYPLNMNGMAKGYYNLVFTSPGSNTQNIKIIKQ